MKNICITGITGQLGSVLAEKYIDEGYNVHGLVRRSSNINTQRIDHIYNSEKSSQLNLVFGDLSDYSSVVKFITEAKPDIFINAGAMSHVRVSFDIPEYTMDVTGTGVLRCLEGIRNYSPNTKFIQCSSSELWGRTPPPQNEKTVFQPRSPYAVAKAAGYYTTINYREAYGLFASNAIMSNYESPHRGPTFVTKKITTAAARIKLGLQDKLYLGNLEAKRDWSSVKDTVRAVMLMADSDIPDDFVIATGVSRSVKEFLELVFTKLDLNWQDYVVFDEKYLRPSEVDHLEGDSSKIKKFLGWEPKISFEEMVDEMVQYDLSVAQKEINSNRK